MQGLEITRTWLCTEQPLQSLAGPFIPLAPTSAKTHHTSLCAPGTRLLHWDATSPPFLRLHPEHLPPMSRALCSKATGCSLIQFRMQPGRAPGPSAPQDMPSATMNTVISISHPPGAELCRDGALQLRAGGKQKLSREGYLAPAGHSPLLFTLAWIWPG